MIDVYEQPVLAEGERIIAVPTLIKKLPPGTKVHIDGYTDASGAAAANVALSRRRAEAVRALLIDAGVAPAMLKAKGHGAARATEGDNRSDRRIEFSVK